MTLNGIRVFHDETNEDAVIESVLTSSPDFDNQDSLLEILEQSIEKFAVAIGKTLKDTS